MKTQNTNKMEQRHHGTDTTVHTNNYLNVWNINKIEQRHDGS